MNSLSDLLILSFIFLVGAVFGMIGTLLVGVFNHFVLNYFLGESTIRNVLSLFLVLLFSFFCSLVGLVGFLGFAADENAGAIVPYYLSIAFIASILYTVGYYFIRIK